MRRTGPLIIILAALATFACSLGNGYAYDDVPIIEENPEVENAFAVARIFTTAYWDGDGNGLYRPLSIWSYAIERAVYGVSPFGTHLINVLLNALVSWLVFVLVRQLGGRDLFALATGLFFAVHPIHAEVVANGVGRAELGAAACCLGAIILHLRALESEHGRARGIATALLLYFCGLCFKESAVMMPALLFGLDWVVRSRGRLRLAHFGGPLLYVIPLGVFLLLRSNVITDAVPPHVMFDGAGAGQRLMLAGDVLGRYAIQMAVPLTFISEYEDYRAPVRAMVLTDAWRVLVVVGLFIAAGLLARRGAIWPLTGLLFMLVAIFPASNIAIPIGILRADRVMFLPSLGYAIIFGWLIDLIARRQRTAALVLLTVVTLALGVRSAVRSLDWKSSETLVRTTVRDNPGAAPAWSYLAAIHRDAGRNEEAMEGFRRASELYGGVMQTPRMQERYAISRFNYAMAMLGSDRAQATAMLESIVEGETQLYEAFMNLGGVRFEDGDTEGAIAMFRRAIATEPDRFEAHGNLAVVLASDGRRDEAIAALREMMRREAPAELVRQIEATVQELAPAP